MRIVAADAGDPGIAFSPAGAGFETIRGKSDVVDPGIAELIDVPPGAVAGAAEIHRGRCGSSLAKMMPENCAFTTMATKECSLGTRIMPIGAG